MVPSVQHFWQICTVKKLHVEQYKYLLFFLKGGGVAQIIALAGIIVGLMYNFVILHNFCNASDV